jgi:hypothetical protein
MEKNRIWLGVFALIAALGIYLWWSGSRSTVAPAKPESSVEAQVPQTEEPHLEKEETPFATPTPPTGHSNGASETPPFNSQPPSSYASPPPNLETFGESGAAQGNPPTFEPSAPPSNFENPGFVTPPPAPPPFENEAVPFQDSVPFEDGQGFDGPPPEEFVPPPSPEGD